MAEQDYVNGEIQLVVFKLGREEYGVSILQVQEIKRMTDITRVPHTPDYIMGVINLRGSVLPVIDLKKRLNLPPQEYKEDARIIIAKVDELAVGMIVDQVSEVMTMNQASVESPETVVSHISSNYLSGVGKQDNRLLILLDLGKIIGIGQEVKEG